MNVLFDKENLEIRAKKHKIPQFKVKQIFFELFKNQRIEWDEMTTLSNQLKDELKYDIEYWFSFAGDLSEKLELKKQEEEEKVKEILAFEMENAVKLEVPLKVEVTYGKNWYQTK